jgi:transposase
MLTRTSSVSTRGSAGLALTELQWVQVSPLLPSPYSGVGRPPLDHRRMLDGMLWVMRGGASWRELPARFGKWNTVYCRYRKWRNEGIWQRVLDVMNADHHG